MQDSQVGVYIRTLRGTFKKYVYLGTTQEIRICNSRLRVKAREILSVKSSPRGFSYIQLLEKPLIPIRYPYYTMSSGLLCQGPEVQSLEA